MSIKFKDSEKTITMPSTLVLADASGDTYKVNSDEVEFTEVLDRNTQEILAINMEAEVEDRGTVTNNITFETKPDFDKKEMTSTAIADIGLYNESSDNYEHPDDCSYDTNTILSQETLNEVVVKHK